MVTEEIPQNIISISLTDKIKISLNNKDITFNIHPTERNKLTHYDNSIILMHFLLTNLQFQPNESTMDEYYFFINKIIKKNSPNIAQASQVVNSLQFIINQILLNILKGNYVFTPIINYTHSITNFHILEQDYVTLDKIKHICPLKKVLQLQHKMDTLPYYFI